MGGGGSASPAAAPGARSPPASLPPGARRRCSPRLPPSLPPSARGSFGSARPGLDRLRRPPHIPPASIGQPHGPSSLPSSSPPTPPPSETLRLGVTRRPEPPAAASLRSARACPSLRPGPVR